MTKTALGIIDAQRGFMPAEEGQRLNIPGFGELAVPEGEQIVAPLNRLIGAFAAQNAETFTTQDWHPYQTAHFSNTPNFTTTWPRHCVDGTAGAEMHPGIQLPGGRRRFIKGFEALENGEDDTSYSAYFAIDPTTGLSLPEWMGKHKITSVVLGGLALDYCVKASAVDFRTKAGLDVIVAIDATRGIADQSIRDTLQTFDSLGIETATTDEIINGMAQAA